MMSIRPKRKMSNIKLPLLAPVAILVLLLMTFLSNRAVAVESLRGTVAKPSDALKLNLYDYKIERAKMRTASGAEKSYTVYYPVRGMDTLPPPPYPVVVLIHGFLMTGREQTNNAVYMAQRGFVIVTPNITKILLGDKNRMNNVSDVLDHIRSVTKRSQTQGDVLFGLIDPQRLAIGGNSSGGAVVLESCLEAQKANIPLRAIVSLDGVPWDRTFDRVAQMKPVKVLSLRSVPSLCNYHARILRYLAKLDFPFDDVLINNAHHCDAENPTTIGCMCVCGWTEDKYRWLYQLLLYYYLKDALNAPEISTPSKSFVQFVNDLQKENKVTPQLKQSLAGQ
jgi:acetyl esterase/lipase